MIRSSKEFQFDLKRVIKELVSPWDVPLQIPNYHYHFYDYFAECEIGVKFVQLVGRHSFLPSLGHKLLFVFPLTNAQLDLTKRKMSSNGSANVKHSEAMSDEIITAMSTACGASTFLFELFLKKPRKHLLS